MTILSAVSASPQVASYSERRPALLKSVATPDGRVALLEWPRATPSHGRWVVLSTSGASVRDRQSFDVLADAECYFRHMAIPLPVVTPGHTPADETWWARNSPSLARDFCVEGAVDPTDLFANTIPEIEYHELVETACFGEPELSDDYGGAFGIRWEGGDR